MMVNFILFSLMTAGIALIVERQNGTLQRLMTTRLRRWELIGGKAAGMFCLTFAQQILLIGVAQLFFGVDYLRDPAALLVMMVSLSLVASTLGLLLASVMKSEQALIATTVLVSMAVAALSGAWFPLEITGPTFQTVGHLLPTAWILDGLRGIVVRGFDVADVLPAFARLGGVGGRVLRARHLALPPQRVADGVGLMRGAPQAHLTSTAASPPAAPFPPQAKAQATLHGLSGRAQLHGSLLKRVQQHDQGEARCPTDRLRAAPWRSPTARPLPTFAARTLR